MSHGVSGLLGFYCALAPTIVCIWLSVWVIRRKSEADYPLGIPARWVRWVVILVGFSLGYFAPLKGIRVVSGFTALAFLCWPNLAHHLTKLVVVWTTTTGRVESVSPLDSGWRVTYSFNVGNDRFGGATSVRDGNDSERYCEGQAVTVRYNPIGPDESRVIPSNFVG